MQLSSETILIGVIVGLLAWKEYCAYKDRRLIVEIASNTVKSFQTDADLKAAEVDSAQHMLRKILDDSRDERQKFFDMVSEMSDRVMVRSMQEYAQYGYQALKERPEPEPVTDADELEQELRNDLQSEGMTQEEQDIVIAEGQRAMFGRYRQAQVVNELKDFMPHGNDRTTRTPEPVGAD
jgi:hypothetical protein